jgi:hypothetical protein
MGNKYSSSRASVSPVTAQAAHAGVLGRSDLMLNGVVRTAPETDLHVGRDRILVDQFSCV